MADNYFVETIERITEQMIEEEVLAETEIIRTEGISSVTDIEDTAVDSIAEDKRELIQEFSEVNGIRAELNQIDTDTDTIYQNTVAIAGDTEAVIENDIRQMIVDNGYELNVTNDGGGNVTITIEKVS